MTPTISTRQLDANHDPIWGQGQANFLVDIDAVAQTIQTRLLLLQGEWWANLGDGLPVLQIMLGVGGSGKNSDAVSLAIQQNILGTPYVLAVSQAQSTYNPSNRSFQFNCTVDTAFGQLQVTTNLPGTSAIIPS